MSSVRHLRRLIVVVAVTATAAALASAIVGGGTASAAKGVCKDGTPPPCKPSGSTEAASNNLSFPVIFPDGKPASYVEVADWLFAPVAADPEDSEVPTGCVTEEGVPVGTSVPTDILCYFARQNLGIDEATGLREWVPDTLRVWWLQERTQNRWQVYDPVLPTGTGPLAVTAVDVGDLLESSQTIKNKQVRTEFSLLQTVTDPTVFDPAAQLFEDASIDDFGWANQPVFAAMNMSGAVPGTDQSINEIQGADYGPGPDSGDFAGTGQLIDPSSVKPGFDATVFSRGARLVIQKVTTPDELIWEDALNEWVGPQGSVSPPVVDIGTADGTYTAEINAGGSMIYGYNWSTQTASSLGSGTYRLTFVLDSGVGVLNTTFDTSTNVANTGARPVVIRPGGAGAGQDGYVYIDVVIQLGGGGGGGGGRP